MGTPPPDPDPGQNARGAGPGSHLRSPPRVRRRTTLAQDKVLSIQSLVTAGFFAVRSVGSILVIR
jgi:hypothetical protein